MDRMNCAIAGQWLYLLDGGGVVFSDARQRFAGLDAAGVMAYRAFDAGVELEELERAAGRQSASANLKAIHALAHGRFPDEQPPVELPEREEVTAACEDANGCGATASATTIDFCGVPVALEIPGDAILDLCGDYFRRCKPLMQPPRRRIAARRESGRWAVYVDGRRFFELAHEDQIGLVMMHAARSLLLADAEYDIAFHAAMVARGNQGVLLCAQREAGKSTLAAY